ncbi:MAG TPA: GNAT family N-acetyltransferase [Xanthobacteraceae bacterium]|nr:GNAT family N-acetyltransferase [Xanthobacteraceae bacterium]
MSQEAQPPSTGGYAVVPAKSIDAEQLMSFADAVWPERPRERILTTWWRRAAPEWAVAAIDGPTGRMVGLCAGRPSTWTIDGRVHPALAICDWYVAPDHEGKLLGRRLLRRFETPDRLLYAFSMSDVAAAYLGRLGWLGPYPASLMALPLPGLTRLPLALLRPRAGLDLDEHDMPGGGSLGSLAADFDRVEANNATARVRMRRGADEWAWRLDVCGERQYHVCLARRADAPVGYVVVRRITPGASRILGRRAGAIITDLVAVNDEPAVLRALARRAVAIAARLQVVVVLIATTLAAHRRALVASGFLPPRLPILGRFLRRAAPTFMWSPRGPGAGLAAEDFMFTFADSDVDLNL